MSTRRARPGYQVGIAGSVEHHTLSCLEVWKPTLHSNNGKAIIPHVSKCYFPICSFGGVCVWEKGVSDGMLQLCLASSPKRWTSVMPHWASCAIVLIASRFWCSYIKFAIASLSPFTLILGDRMTSLHPTTSSTT